MLTNSFKDCHVLLRCGSGLRGIRNALAQKIERGRMPLPLIPSPRRLPRQAFRLPEPAREARSHTFFLMNPVNVSLAASESIRSRSRLTRAAYQVSVPSSQFPFPVPSSQLQAPASSLHLRHRA